MVAEIKTAEQWSEVGPSFNGHHVHCDCEKSLKESIKKLQETESQLFEAFREISNLNATIESFGDRKELINALSQIANGRFHIGNDDKGNVFGPPDAAMCRKIANDALRG